MTLRPQELLQRTSMTWLHTQLTVAGRFADTHSGCLRQSFLNLRLIGGLVVRKAVSARHIVLDVPVFAITNGCEGLPDVFTESFAVRALPLCSWLSPYWLAWCLRGCVLFKARGWFFRKCGCAIVYLRGYGVVARPRLADRMIGR